MSLTVTYSLEWRMRCDCGKHFPRREFIDIIERHLHERQALGPLFSTELEYLKRIRSRKGGRKAVCVRDESTSAEAREKAIVLLKVCYLNADNHALVAMTLSMYSEMRDLEHRYFASLVAGIVGGLLDTEGVDTDVYRNALFTAIVVLQTCMQEEVVKEGPDFMAAYINRSQTTPTFTGAHPPSAHCLHTFLGAHRTKLSPRFVANILRLFVNDSDVTQELLCYTDHLSRASLTLVMHEDTKIKTWLPLIMRAWSVDYVQDDVLERYYSHSIVASKFLDAMLTEDHIETMEDAKIVTRVLRALHTHDQDALSIVCISLHSLTHCRTQEVFRYAAPIFIRMLAYEYSFVDNATLAYLLYDVVERIFRAEPPASRVLNMDTPQKALQYTFRTLGITMDGRPILERPAIPTFLAKADAHETVPMWKTAFRYTYDDEMPVLSHPYKDIAGALEPNFDNNDVGCPVCLHAYTNSSEIVFYMCDPERPHHFCLECTIKLENKSVCPLCRSVRVRHGGKVRCAK